MTTDKLTEPRGRDGQRAAYCTCGAVYFSTSSARHQHFARGDEHQRISWARYREACPDQARHLANLQRAADLEIRKLSAMVNRNRLAHLDES